MRDVQKRNPEDRSASSDVDASTVFNDEEPPATIAGVGRQHRHFDAGDDRLEGHRRCIRPGCPAALQGVLFVYHPGLCYRINWQRQQSERYEQQKTVSGAPPDHSFPDLFPTGTTIARQIWNEIQVYLDTEAGPTVQTQPVAIARGLQRNPDRVAHPLTQAQP